MANEPKILDFSLWGFPSPPKGVVWANYISPNSFKKILLAKNQEELRDMPIKFQRCLVPSSRETHYSWRENDSRIRVLEKKDFQLHDKMNQLLFQRHELFEKNLKGFFSRESSIGIRYTRPPMPIKPRKEEWKSFWEELDVLKVWNWDKKYINRGMLDGTQWELNVKREGRRHRRIYGSNAYPEGFDNLLKAIEKLSRVRLWN